MELIRRAVIQTMVRERQWTLRTLVVLVIPPLSEVFEPQIQCHGSAHLNSWSGAEEHFTPEILQGLQQRKFVQRDVNQGRSANCVAAASTCDTEKDLFSPSNSLLVGSVFRKLDSAKGPWIPAWKSGTWGQKSFTPKRHGSNSTRHICAVQFDHTANRTLNALGARPSVICKHLCVPKQV